METFVDIVGFDNYQISNFGKIKNKKTGRILKDSCNGRGYKKIGLINNDGCRCTVRVHRIVCEHFNPNPGNKPQVDHIDCNKANNRADNLRWCTHQENIDWYYEKYHVYKLPKPKKYDSISSMVQKTGKPVCVNGVRYPSAGSAAKYICDNESGKNRATVSKEIRRMISGKRKFGYIYEKYEISSILSLS